MDANSIGIRFFYVKNNVLAKIFLIVLLVIYSMSVSHAQRPNLVKRYFSKLVNDTTSLTKPNLIGYPTVAFSPETSWEIGLSTLLVYSAKGDTLNRLSEMSGFSFITFQNQFGVWFDHALYTDKNKWFFLGRFRLQSFPLLYYGIGPYTPSDYLARVDANQFQFRERVLRKIRKNLYLGIEADFQRLRSVEFTDHLDIPYQKPLGSGGSNSVALGVGLVFDTRHNVLNVRHGYFSELALLRYDRLIGSTHSFSTIISDSRIYKSINKRDVLAWHVLGQFNIGDTPFNMLSLMGGENMMRGYYMGRYRDKNQLATQLEYRFLPLPLGFTNRIGAAVFAGTGTVFPDFGSLNVNKFVFAGGGGLRVLIFPKRDIWTRFDVAFTKEGHGFYFFIGESF